VEHFARSRGEWVRRQLARVAKGREYWPELSLAPDSWLRFGGGKLHVSPVRGSGRAYLVGDRLVVPIGHGGDPDERLSLLAGKVSGWMRARAEEILPAKVAEWAAKTGLQPAGVLVRDYSARWGTCFRDGSVKLSWRLVMMPPEVVDYVVVHELCHLRHLDHGAGFHALVERHLPNWRRWREWLNTHGGGIPL
jgi:hypothetical protein